jgi:transglutaminase-like putative cysteine protease
MIERGGRIMSFRWTDPRSPDFPDRVRLLRILAELGARQLGVRAWTLQALKAAGLTDARNRGAVAAAILRYAHRTMVWAREIDEQFVRPDITIDMGGGDCDDLAMLVYAALRSVGVPPEHLEFRFLRNGDSWFHVWIVVFLERHGWYHLEPSIAGIAPGASPLPLVQRARAMV